jgi:hypothetical protein
MHWVYLAFEYSQLDPDTEILAGSRDLSQPSPSLAGHSADIVTDEHQHASPRDKRRIGVEITTQVRSHETGLLV